MSKANKSILIVDDDQTILKSFNMILQAQGYTVDTATTGKEALEKTKTKSYNLALLDIKLPDMDGTRLLAKMHQSTPKMMKIMVTGYPGLDNAVDALNLGADAYTMKPVDPRELIKVVDEKLREQEEAEKMTQKRVTEWIKTRIRKLETEPKTE